MLQMKCDVASEVCKQLEFLLREAAEGQRSAERKLDGLLNYGRQMCEVTLQALVFAVAANAPGAPQQWLAL
eukprot:1775281-Amphidinium_carterae.1